MNLDKNKNPRASAHGFVSLSHKSLIVRSPHTGLSLRLGTYLLADRKISQGLPWLHRSYVPPPLWIRERILNYFKYEDMPHTFCIWYPYFPFLSIWIITTMHFNCSKFLLILTDRSFTFAKTLCILIVKVFKNTGDKENDAVSQRKADADFHESGYSRHFLNTYFSGTITVYFRIRVDHARNYFQRGQT